MTASTAGFFTKTRQSDVAVLKPYAFRYFSAEESVRAQII